MLDSLIKQIPFALILFSIPALLVSAFSISSRRMDKAGKKVVNNPTYVNALNFYNSLCHFTACISNYPQSWNKYRSIFYKINGSPEIPSDLKRDIKDRLVKMGLHIDGMRIIDNYKKE